ncbi:hypothetical protein AAZX31_04G222900 [Glycine max]
MLFFVKLNTNMRSASYCISVMVVFRGVCVLNRDLGSGSVVTVLEEDTYGVRAMMKTNVEAHDFFRVDTVSVQENGGARVEFGVCG